jgi:hypothetical protein
MEVLEMEKLRQLKAKIQAQLKTQRDDPYQSDYGDGLIRGLEIALAELSDIEARS